MLFHLNKFHYNETEKKDKLLFFDLGLWKKFIFQYRTLKSLECNLKLMNQSTFHPLHSGDFANGFWCCACHVATTSSLPCINSSFWSVCNKFHPLITELLWICYPNNNFVLDCLFAKVCGCSWSDMDNWKSSKQTLFQNEESYTTSA